MEYAILALESPADFAERSDPAKSDDYYAAWAAYVDALWASGLVKAGAGLQEPFTATTVRVRGGATQVQDGPYADVKEHLGGLFVIDVPDLDAALEWAARCPAAANGAVEVRPVLPPRN
jgi:hypothetical protein